MKLNLHHNRTDFVVYGTCLLLVLALLLTLLGTQQTAAKVVHVYYDNQLVHTMLLSQDETYTMEVANYPLLLDQLVIEVKDGQVRVVEEESPKHYCSLLGYQSQAGTSIICAPNSVKIVIEGSTDIDYQPGGVS